MAFFAGLYVSPRHRTFSVSIDARPFDLSPDLFPVRALRPASLTAEAELPASFPYPVIRQDGSR
jgi:hypothetical protein